MRNMVVNSLEIVLWAVLAAFVIVGTIIMPVVGTIIGLVLGAAVTGFGFVLLSINSHLADIARAQGLRSHDVVGRATSSTISSDG